MSARLIQFLRDLRDSYWFLPALMALGAALLSVLTLEIDARGKDLVQRVPWLFDSGSDGARAVLATIASSMIGIAGVTFSMTLVAVSFASGNFGPRLIGNFMRDRGNQVVLGTFISAFVYSLLILRRVRSEVNELTSFVPQVSVLTALALALLGVSVLIYFIHHIPESINVSRLTAEIGRQLTADVQRVFPAGVGQAGDAASTPRRLERFDPDRTGWIEADTCGYLQALNEDRLLELASQLDLLLGLQYRPGDFAVRGDRLLLFTPAKDGVSDELLACFAFGAERTVDQDVLYLADQLVEILARALSPGVNDPLTAIGCIDWMKSVLSEAVGREAPDAERHDPEGRLRLIAHPVRFARLLERLVGRSLEYVARDMNASLAMLEMLAAVGCRATDEGRQELIRSWSRRVVEVTRSKLPSVSEKAGLSERLETLDRLLDSSDLRSAKLDDQGWLGGTA